MELRRKEVKLNMQTLLDAHFHLDWWVHTWLLAQILDDELFLLCDAVVVAVDHDVEVVLYAHHDSVVALELLLHAIEAEVVSHVVSQGSRRLEVSDQLEEGAILVLVVQVFDQPHEFNADPHVI